jgi:hypothetical protein
LGYAEERFHVDVPLVLGLAVQMLAERGSSFRAPWLEQPLAQGLECGGVDRVTAAAGTLNDVERGGSVAG